MPLSAIYYRINTYDHNQMFKPLSHSREQNRELTNLLNEYLLIYSLDYMAHCISTKETGDGNFGRQNRVVLFANRLESIMPPTLAALI